MSSQCVVSCILSIVSLKGHPTDVPSDPETSSTKVLPPLPGSSLQTYLIPTRDSLSPSSTSCVRSTLYPRTWAPQLERGQSLRGGQSFRGRRIVLSLGVAGRTHLLWKHVAVVFQVSTKRSTKASALPVFPPYRVCSLAPSPLRRKLVRLTEMTKKMS